MSATPVDFEQIKETGIQYPTQWSRFEFTCKCGVKCRVDVERTSGMAAGPFFQHCPEGEQKYIAGRLIAKWEARDGSWVLVKKFR